VTVKSTHKKGIGLSGMSVALFNNDEMAASFARFCDAGGLSTSPPYLLYSGVEQVLDGWQSPEGTELARRLVAESRAFATACEAIPGIRWIRPDDLALGLVADPSHVLLDVGGTGLTGYAILGALADQFGLDAEKGTLSSLLFLFDCAQIDAWPGVVTGLAAVVSDIPRMDAIEALPAPPERWPTVMSMRAARFARQERVSPQDAVGQTAAQSVAAWPGHWGGPHRDGYHWCRADFRRGAVSTRLTRTVRLGRWSPCRLI